MTAKENALRFAAQIEALIAATHWDLRYVAELQAREMLTAEDRLDLDDVQAILQKAGLPPSADEDSLREAINRLALDVQYRAGWNSNQFWPSPDEYRINLTTCAPECRIVGDMRNGYVISAKLEYTDEWAHWANPWIELGEIEDESLLDFAKLVIE